MEPRDYGASVWLGIHAFAGLSTEPHKRQAFARYMKALQEAFPCDLCAGHLAEGMRTYPIERYLDSAENLLKWTYIQHDLANNHANADHPNEPRKFSPPWEEIKAKYLSVPSPTPPPPRVTAPPPHRTVAPPPHRTVAPPPVARSNRRLTVVHPAFEQFKQSFQPTRRRW